MEINHRDINNTQWEAVVIQRHWTRTPAGHAPACEIQSTEEGC